MTIAVALAFALAPGALYAQEPKRAAPSPFDYTAYARLLETFVDEGGMVNYKAMKDDRADLDSVLSAVRVLRGDAFDKWGKNDKIAFYCNAYNALTLKAILDHYPIKASGLSALRHPKNSIRQIDGVWDELRFLVMGEPRTLDEIEHEILRKEFREPRIHMALVCAAMGCPRLRDEPYLGARLDEQLDDQARRYLATPSGLRLDRAEGTVHLSKILAWFAEDFVAAYATDTIPGHNEEKRAVLNFVARHTAPSVGVFLRSEKRTIRYIDYDWSLNEQGS